MNCPHKGQGSGEVLGWIQVLWLFRSALPPPPPLLRTKKNGIPIHLIAEAYKYFGIINDK